MDNTNNGLDRLEIYHIGSNTAFDPMKIILMLYEGAIDFLKSSIEHAMAGNQKDKDYYVNKAKSIINELDNVLNVESGGEIAITLRNLYNVMDRHLNRAINNNDIPAIKDVIQWMSGLLESWKFVDASNQCIYINDLDRIMSKTMSH